MRVAFSPGGKYMFTLRQSSLSVRLYVKGKHELPSVVASIMLSLSYLKSSGLANRSAFANVIPSKFTPHASRKLKTRSYSLRRKSSRLFIFKTLHWWLSGFKSSKFVMREASLEFKTIIRFRCRCCRCRGFLIRAPNSEAGSDADANPDDKGYSHTNEKWASAFWSSRKEQPKK